jgi:hypothetical protein
MKSDLNIGVVLPVWNSMPHICGHVSALNQWIEQVREVIVVDSYSGDGTLDYIKEHLNHKNVTIISHPPGLYESWNAGIERVTSQYTYIATVNDFMPIKTLLQLYAEAEIHMADVVVSAPTFISNNLNTENQKWPVHRFIEASGIVDSYELSHLELLAWNSIDLPGTLIGSSASNLYRTAHLKKQPFPDDYGHAGDSAWALSASLDSRWVVVPQAKSDFCQHGGSNTGGRSGRGLRAQLYALAASQISKAAGSIELEECKRELLNELGELVRLWDQKENAVLEYIIYRNSIIPWFLQPRAWLARADKNNCKITISKQVECVLEKLDDLYCYTV